MSVVGGWIQRVLEVLREKKQEVIGGHPSGSKPVGDLEPPPPPVPRESGPTPFPDDDKPI
jgi:hypothetical protein